jgi:hypothetical protein
MNRLLLTLILGLTIFLQACAYPGYGYRGYPGYYGYRPYYGYYGYRPYYGYGYAYHPVFRPPPPPLFGGFRGGFGRGWGGGPHR